MTRMTPMTRISKSASSASSASFAVNREPAPRRGARFMPDLDADRTQQRRQPPQLVGDDLGGGDARRRAEGVEQLLRVPLPPVLDECLHRLRKRIVLQN